MKPFVSATLILFVSNKLFVKSFCPSHKASFARVAHIQTNLFEQLGQSKDEANHDIVSIENIDLVHAHECADHYGECSVAEIEKMRDGKHSYTINQDRDKKLAITDQFNVCFSIFTSYSIA